MIGFVGLLCDSIRGTVAIMPTCISIPLRSLQGSSRYTPLSQFPHETL